jgi:hypothetical protein
VKVPFTHASGSPPSRPVLVVPPSRSGLVVPSSGSDGPSTATLVRLRLAVAITVIAFWLGHESPETTHGHVKADLAMKEVAVQRVHDPTPRRARFRASDPLLACLDGP